MTPLPIKVVRWTRWTRRQQDGAALDDQGEVYPTNYNFPLLPPSLKEESQILYLNGIIMVSRANNMCKPGLDPIDCKSSFILKKSPNSNALSAVRVAFVIL